MARNNSTGDEEEDDQLATSGAASEPQAVDTSEPVQGDEQEPEYSADDYEEGEEPQAATSAPGYAPAQPLIYPGRQLREPAPPILQDPTVDGNFAKNMAATESYNSAMDSLEGRQAYYQQRAQDRANKAQQVAADRASAQQAAAELADKNSQLEAQYRTQGVKFYTDKKSGELTPVLDDDGNPQYHAHTFPIEYDEQGRAVQRSRDETGAVSTALLDANAKVGFDKNQPNAIYRQNKHAAWDYLGSADEALNSDDPDIAAAGLRAHQVLATQLHKAGGAVIDQQIADVTLKQKLAENNALALSAQYRDLDAKLNGGTLSDGTPVPVGINKDPTLTQTEGAPNWGMISRRPTVAALMAQDQQKQLKQQLAALDAKGITGVPADDVAKAKEPLKGAYSDAIRQRVGWTAVSPRNGSDINQILDQRRTQVLEAGGDPDQDPVIQAVEAKKQQLGLVPATPSQADVQDPVQTLRSIQLQASQIPAGPDRVAFVKNAMASLSAANAQPTTTTPPASAAQPAAPAPAAADASDSQDSATPGASDQAAAMRAIAIQASQIPPGPDRVAFVNNAKAALASGSATLPDTSATSVASSASQNPTAAVPQSAQQAKPVPSLALDHAQEQIRTQAANLPAGAARAAFVSRAMTAARSGDFTQLQPTNDEKAQAYAQQAGIGEKVWNGLKVAVRTIGAGIGHGVKGLLELDPAVPYSRMTEPQRQAKEAQFDQQAAPAIAAVANDPKAINPATGAYYGDELREIQRQKLLVQRGREIKGDPTADPSLYGGALSSQQLDESYGTNPQLEKTIPAAFGRVGGSMAGFVAEGAVNPMLPLAQMVSSASSEGGDAAVEAAQQNGETDPEKLQAIRNHASAKSAAYAAGTLPLYFVGGKLAGVAAQKILPEAGALGRAGLETAVSGAANVGASAVNRRLETGQWSLPTGEQLGQDLGWAALHGKGAYDATRQARAVLDGTDKHAATLATVATDDSVPSETRQQAEQALNDLTDHARSVLGQKVAPKASDATTAPQGAAGTGPTPEDLQGALGEVRGLQPQGLSPEDTAKTQSVARGLVKIASGRVTADDVQRAIDEGGPNSKQQAPGVAVNPVDSDLAAVAHEPTPDGQPRVTIQDGAVKVNDNAIANLEQSGATKTADLLRAHNERVNAAAGGDAESATKGASSLPDELTAINQRLDDLEKKYGPREQWNPTTGRPEPRRDTTTEEDQLLKRRDALQAAGSDQSATTTDQRASETPTASKVVSDRIARLTTTLINNGVHPATADLFARNYVKENGIASHAHEQREQVKQAFLDAGGHFSKTGEQEDDVHAANQPLHDQLAANQGNKPSSPGRGPVNLAQMPPAVYSAFAADRETRHVPTKDHRQAISEAIANGQPVSAEALDAYGIEPPADYEKKGALYAPSEGEHTTRAKVKSNLGLNDGEAARLSPEELQKLSDPAADPAAKWSKAEMDAVTAKLGEKSPFDLSGLKDPEKTVEEANKEELQKPLNVTPEERDHARVIVGAALRSGHDTWLKRLGLQGLTERKERTGASGFQASGLETRGGERIEFNIDELADSLRAFGTNADKLGWVAKGLSEEIKHICTTRALSEAELEDIGKNLSPAERKAVEVGYNRKLSDYHAGAEAVRMFLQYRQEGTATEDHAFGLFGTKAENDGKFRAAVRKVLTYIRSIATGGADVVSKQLLAGVEKTEAFMDSLPEPKPQESAKPTQPIEPDAPPVAAKPRTAEQLAHEESELGGKLVHPPGTTHVLALDAAGRGTPERLSNLAKESPLKGAGPYKSVTSGKMVKGKFEPIGKPTVKAPKDQPPSAKSSLDASTQKDIRDAFEGLQAAKPRTDEERQGDDQRGIPPERLDTFIKLATKLLSAGIDTPEKMARELDSVVGEASQPFHQAMWDAFGMVKPELRGTHDWRAIRENADGGGDVAAARPEPSTESAFAGSPIVEMPLSSLSLSKDVPQFKSGADGSGVVEPLAGKFDRTGVGPIQVWIRKDGRREVISGRHRLDLARRSGETTIPAQIHRESDGFTAQMAARLDAHLNIRDGQGSVVDYAAYHRYSEESREAAESKGLLGRSKGQAGFSIGKGASGDTFALHQSGRLSDAQAQGIAEAAPGNAAAQAVGLRAALAGKSADFSANLIKAAQMRAAERSAAGEQGDLFGFEDSAIREMESQAKVAAGEQRSIREQVRAVEGAANKPAIAAKMGVDVRDPEGVTKRIAQLKGELSRWENWPMHSDLVARTRETGEPRAENSALPTLRAGERQGDLLSKQTEDLKLVGEKGADTVRAAEEKSAAEKAEAEARALQDRQQGSLFAAKPQQTVDHDTIGSYLTEKGVDPNDKAAQENLKELATVHEGGPDYSQLSLFPDDGRSGKRAARVPRSPGVARDEAGRAVPGAAVDHGLIAQRRAENAGIAEPTGDAAREALRTRGRLSSLIPELIAPNGKAWDVRGAIIQKPEDAFKLLQAVRSPYVESLKIAVLDDAGRVVHSEIVSIGNLNESIAHPREIFRSLSRIAEGGGPRNLVIAHNHPSGDPTPSQADKTITGRMERVAHSLGFRVIDHVITNGEHYHSFRERGELAYSTGAKYPFGDNPGRERANLRAIKNSPDGLADWETVPRSELKPLGTTDQVRDVVKSLRNDDPNAGHIFYLNTKYGLNGVERIEDMMSQPAEEIENRMARGAMREGAYGVTFHFPGEFKAAWEKLVDLRDAASVHQIKIIDALFADESEKGGYLSTAEQGLMEETPNYGSLVEKEGSHEEPEADEETPAVKAPKEPWVSDGDPHTLLQANLARADAIAKGFENIPGVQPDDVRQIARIALAKAAKSFNPARGDFGPWAGTVIRNDLRQFWRSRVGDRNLPVLDAPLEGEDADGETAKSTLPDENANVPKHVEAAETARVMEKLLSEMPERMATALRLRSQGMDMPTIGEKIGTVKQGVERILNEGYRRLRGRLGEMGITKPSDILQAVKPKTDEAPAATAEEPHEFASTQVNMPDGLSKDLDTWSHKNIPDSILAKDGREDEHHVTALFGLHADTPDSVREEIKNFGPVTVKLGKISVFHNPEHDVVKVDVDSPDLHRLNAKLRTLDHTNTFPDYKPHLTLAYVDKGEGKQFAGRNDFEGKKVTFDHLIFSGKDRNHVELPLTGGKSGPSEDEQHGRASVPAGTPTLHADGATVTGPAGIHLAAAKPVKAYHGSGADFDRFDLEHAGSGEGALAYGFGVYLGESDQVGKFYQDKLKKEGSAGVLYKVKVKADQGMMLDWDKKIRDQDPRVIEALKSVPGTTEYGQLPDYLEPEFILGKIQTAVGGVTGMTAMKEASKALKEAGIPGIKYMDEGSRYDSVREAQEEASRIRENLTPYTISYDAAQKDFKDAAARMGMQPDQWMIVSGGKPIDLAKSTAKMVAMKEAATRPPAMDSPMAEKLREAEAKVKAAEKAAKVTRNYVVFDENDIEITHKNGQRVKFADAVSSRETSGSQDQSETAKVRDSIVSNLADYPRQVMESRLAGDSPEEMAKKFNLSPENARQASDNAARAVAGRMEAQGIDGKAAEAALAPRTLQATNPLKTFYDEDVKPTVEGAGKGFADTLKGLAHWLSPRSGAPRDAVDEIMAMKGGRDKADFVLEQTTRHIDKVFSKMPQSDQVAFVDRVKRGQAQPTPELQGIADMIRKVDTATWNEAQKFKPNLAWLDNHYRVLWKTIPGSKPKDKGGFLGAFRRPLEGSKGFTKQHTLQDMSEGLAKGGVPYSFNPMVMFRAAQADMRKFITAQKMWEAVKDLGFRKFVKPGGDKPEGWTKLDDRISSVYFRAPEGIVHAGDWYVEPGVARILNNHLSRDYVREFAPTRGLLALKNATTAMELSLSPFHAIFESGEAIGSSIGLGLQKIYNRGLLQGDTGALVSGLKDIATSIAAPYTTSKLGGAMIRSVSQKDFWNSTEGKWVLKRVPDAADLLNDLFTGGGKLAMHEDYKINTVRTFIDNLNSKNWIGATLRALPAANEMLMKPLFEKYIPQLKTGMFMKEYSNELAQRSDDLGSGKITRPELARKVWDFVEDRLGEMNFDNMFWNRTFKSAAQLMFRSVTWKMGNLRSTGGAFAGQAKEFMDAVKEHRAPVLHRKMGWLFGMSALTAAMSTAIMQLYTGKQPENLRDLAFPRVDPNDDQQRVSTPTYWKDLVHLFHSPGHYVESSLSGIIGEAAELMNNRDYYGTKIRNEDDGIGQQALDVGKFAGGALLPFSISGYKKFSDSDQDMARKILPLLSFQPAPKYVSQSPAHQLADEFMEAKMKDLGARTKEQHDHGVEKSKILGRARNGDLAPLHEALRAGTITYEEGRQIAQHARLTPFQAKMHSLSLAQAERVYEAGSEAEKDELRPVLLEKNESAHKRADITQAQYLANKAKFSGAKVAPQTPVLHQKITIPKKNFAKAELVP